jgi:diguanylate cyclase (GGDEF)-like protein/PAS domain S-box-containing protein
MCKSRISQSLDIGRFLRYLTNIPDSILNHPHDVVHTRRVYILFSISIIGIIALLPFGMIALIMKSYTLGMLDFILASILAVNLSHARRYKNYNSNIYFGIVFSAILFVYTFLTGRIESTGFVWCYTFPLIAFFLLGSKKGALATILILLPVVILFLMKTPPSILANYSFDFKLRFLSSFLVVFVFSYLFEYSREKNQEELQGAHDDLEKRVDERTSDLQEAIQSLQKEISERRRIAEALRESEEKYRTILENIEDGYYEVNLAGNFTFFNDSMCRIFGYPKEELMNMNDRQYTDKENAKKLFQAYNKVYKTGEPRGECDWEIIRKDGTKRCIEASISLKKDSSGKPIGFRGIVREITDRKRSEEKLRDSEERFRQLAENIREVFYIYEGDTNHLCYISPAYKEIWGCPSSQSLYQEPKSLLDAVYPEDKDRVMRSLGKKSQGEVEEVYRIVRPDGSIRWINDRSFPVYDGSGKMHRIVGIATDITDHKMGEEKLKHLSLHDSLTGLYNRIYFEEEINRIEKARYDTLGVVMCDVDGLKLVNDTLGHDQGDNLLVAAARVIRESCREGDLAARIGGDEFSVILPNTTEPAVENACQRIQEAIASYNATHPELPLSISVGFAISNGVYKNAKELFKEADNNMYREKLYRTNNFRSSIFKNLINTLKSRDLISERHVIRLEKLLASAAPFIGIPKSNIYQLFFLARFHDIGKVGISDSVLFKQGAFTPDEWTEMKRHCEIGYRIALSAPELVPIADWILKHHEWWNGQGYPLGIKGEEIPIECRLLAIADAYEAITSVRPYRRTFFHAEAVAELLRHSGTQFDPKLLEKFVQMLKAHPSRSEYRPTAAV